MKFCRHHSFGLAVALQFVFILFFLLFQSAGTPSEQKFGLCQVTSMRTAEQVDRDDS